METRSSKSQFCKIMAELSTGEEDLELRGGRIVGIEFETAQLWRTCGG